jgi:hypothetical protein
MRDNHSRMVDSEPLGDERFSCCHEISKAFVGERFHLPGCDRSPIPKSLRRLARLFPGGRQTPDLFGDE